MTLPNSVQTGDPGHVEHHNAIKALLDERITAATASATYVPLTGAATIDGDKTFTGTFRHTGSKAGLFGSEPTDRIPFGMNVIVDAAAAKASGTSNTLGLAITSQITGDLTGITGADPGHWWGMNLFAVVNTPARGVTTPVGLLAELALLQDGGTINTARGFEAGLSFYGTAANAAVTQMETARITAPTRKGGATGGTVTNAYGLFIESVVGFGTSSNFSLFVAGGISRFSGRVDVAGDIMNTNTSGMNVYAGFSEADGARLQLLQSGAGGHIRTRMSTAGAELQMFDGSAITFAVTRTGLPKWSLAGNAQTTVGAAGTASALPAAPSKYMKIIDSTGATLVVPAYAAA